MTFSGKVALVTGAGSGIGRLACRRLEEAGAAVAALDVDRAGLDETARGRAGVQPFVVDVTDGDAVGAAVAQTEAELGPIDRLVHAAAVLLPGRTLDQPIAEVARTMDVNVLGTVRVVDRVLPGMLERGRGDLVTFASLAGWVPSHDMAAYTASKFAVVAYTEILAHEHRGRGVRFACVCPPVVDTPMVSTLGARTPASIASQRPIPAGEVLDALERDLDRGRLFVFPGRASVPVWWLRRLAPGLAWRRLERTRRVRAQPGRADGA